MRAGEHPREMRPAETSIPAIRNEVEVVVPDVAVRYRGQKHQTGDDRHGDGANYRHVVSATAMTPLRSELTGGRGCSWTAEITIRLRMQGPRHRRARGQPTARRRDRVRPLGCPPSPGTPTRGSAGRRRACRETGG